MAMAILLANTLPALSQTPAAARSPATPSHAATPPTAPKRDPFVKNQTPGASSRADKGSPPIPQSLAFTFEVYALSQDDAAQVLEESGTGEARHAAVLALMKEGKAHLETLLSCVTKSGQRAVIESVDEVRYGTDSRGTRMVDGSIFSYDFETRNVGDTLEFEPTESPDGKFCDLNFVPQRVRLLGFSDVSGNLQKPLAVAAPEFQTGKITTAITMVMGESEFLGTMSNPPQLDDAEQKAPGNETRLAFGRMDSTYTGSASVDTARPEVPTNIPPIPLNIELELSFYSLDREAARQILSEGFKDESCYNAVKALAGKNEAKLERVAVLKTKLGQRAVVEEVKEVRYATGFGLGSSGTNASASAKADVVPTAFETRNAGLTLEVEPTLDSSGKVLDINMVPQLVSYEGDLRRSDGGAQVEPQPLFETRKIVTALDTPIGEHAFIGTYSDPGDDGVNGRKDTGRVWFGFIRGTLD